MKDKTYILLRRDRSDNDMRFLGVSPTNHTEVIGEKIFPEHGDIVNRGMAGNGYHGNCSNCGLALVTDLGYCSWEDTTCKRAQKEVKHKAGSNRWFKRPHRATEFNSEDAYEEFLKQSKLYGWDNWDFKLLDNE